MDSFQRHFLIPFSTVPSRASKAFDGRSRADVMCRCIVNGLMISANTRNDTCVACVLLGSPDLLPVTLLCCGQHMRALHPTEKTVAGILQRALPPAPGHPGDLQELDTQGLLNSYDGRRNCCQGTWLLPGGVAAALSHLLSPTLSGLNPVILILQEGAEPLGSVISTLMTQNLKPPSSVITILGDDAGLTPSQQEDIQSAAQDAGARVVYASLGPMQLLASQCITLVHHYLDLAVGPSDTQKPKYDPNDPWLDKIRPCRICYPPGLQADAQQQQQQQQQQQLKEEQPQKEA